MEDEEHSAKTGKKEFIDLRYGVIQENDLERDLQHWESMLVSSMMQRPIKVIHQND